MHGLQINEGQIKEVGLPFPLIEWDWSPELEMNMPYSEEKSTEGYEKKRHIYLLGWKLKNAKYKI